MNSSAPSPDLALVYLRGLEDIVRQGRQAPLEKLLTARLHQSSEEIEGLISPPLDRHEPDASLLLYHLYERLADDEAARDYLRRSVIDLYRNLLGDPSSDLAQVGALSRLIGYYQVATRPELARDLRWALWGLMRDGMSRPMRDMMELTGTDLIRANHILDLWLAVTPPLCEDITLLMKQEITEAFLAHNKGIKNNKNPSTDEPFQLLLFSFHALLKANPQEAGCTGFASLCRTTQGLAGRPPNNFSRRLHGDCAELGRALVRYDAWQSAFRGGLRESSNPKEQKNELYWQALDRLGQATWFRSLTPARKRAIAEDKVVRYPKEAANSSLNQVAHA